MLRSKWVGPLASVGLALVPGVGNQAALHASDCESRANVRIDDGKANLGQLQARFNRLMNEGKYLEAHKLAQQALCLKPRNPAVIAMVQMSGARPRHQRWDLPGSEKYQWEGP